MPEWLKQLPLMTVSVSLMLGAALFFTLDTWRMPTLINAGLSIALAIGTFIAMQHKQNG